MTAKSYEIFNYAMDKRVIPVSPNSFYAYLMAIAMGLKGFRIEENAKILKGELGRVQQDFGKFYDDFCLVGTHLKRAATKYDDTEKKADRFKDQVARVTNVEVAVEQAEEQRVPQVSQESLL